MKEKNNWTRCVDIAFEPKSQNQLNQDDMLWTHDMKKKSFSWSDWVSSTLPFMWERNQQIQTGSSLSWELKVFTGVRFHPRRPRSPRAPVGPLHTTCWSEISSGFDRVKDPVRHKSAHQDTQKQTLMQKYSSHDGGNSTFSPFLPLGWVGGWRKG